MQLKLCCGFFILNVRCKFAYSVRNARAHVFAVFTATGRRLFLFFHRKLAIKTGNAILVACFKHCSHNKKTYNTVRKNYACSERHSVFKKS